MATRAKDACWALAQVLVVICIMCPAFFIWAPWQAVRAISEATPRTGSECLMTTCIAVRRFWKGTLTPFQSGNSA